MEIRVLRRVLVTAILSTFYLTSYCQSTLKDTGTIKLQGYSGGMIHEQSDYQFDDSILTRLSESPSHTETHSVNISFDYNKTNADRFVHSPCITQLGFDTHKDQVLQEQLFKECEDGLKEEKVKQILIALLITIGMCVIVYLGVKIKNAPSTG